MEQRTITLPSGLQVTIRKPGGLDQHIYRQQVLAAAQVAGHGLEDDLESRVASMKAWLDQPDGLEVALERQAARLGRQCVSPAFALPNADGMLPEGARDIRELDDEDYSALRDACDAWTREVAEAVRPTSDTTSSPAPGSSPGGDAAPQPSTQS